MLGACVVSTDRAGACVDNTDANEAERLYKLGKRFSSPNSYELAFSYFQLSSNMGNLDALYECGRCYYDGNGVEKNFAKAAECYQQGACRVSTDHAGANKGHLECINGIGYCYLNGKGVQQDYKKAYEYAQMSANNGNRNGRRNLAHCYFKGKGVQQDYKKALEYYSLALDVNYMYECEIELLKEFNKSLKRDDYVYAYPLYVKHNCNGLKQLQRILHSEYTMALQFMPKVLNRLITSYLL